MRRTLGVCAALLLAASSAAAGIVNGGFESGDFSGWTLNNNGGTANVLTGGAPEGQKYAQIITAASAGASAADVVLQQDFAGEAGDMLSFTYTLSVSMSPPAIAYGCFTATNNITGHALFDYCLTGNTPWLSESYPLTETGSYTLKFHATAIPSAAASCEARIGIDNVRLTSGSEPSTWAINTDGKWSTPSNWIGDVPNGPGTTACFTGATPATVNVDSPVTVGHLWLDAGGLATNYTLSGSTITLNNSGGTGTGAVIDVAAGSHTISASVILNDNASITGSGSVNLSDGVTGNYALSIAGNVTATSIQVSTLNIGSVGTPQTVPEPSTIILLGVVVPAFGWWWVRKT